MKNLRKLNRVFISPYYSKLSRREVVNGEFLKNSCIFVEYAEKSKVKSSEYSLSNLISVGAFDKLNYVSMSISSDMNFVDNFSDSYFKLKNDVSETTES